MRWILFLGLMLGQTLCTLVPGLTHATTHKKFTQFHSYYKFAPKRRLGFRAEHWHSNKDSKTIKVWLHLVKFSLYSYLTIPKQ
jgi:hypothetical protein